MVLKKGKSIREVMKEKGVLVDYLKHHKTDPASKYHFNNYNVALEPMAYMDVSNGLSFLFLFFFFFQHKSLSVNVSSTGPITRGYIVFNGHCMYHVSRPNIPNL